MAKNGFNIFDSDMHIMEPPDLWERYIDAEFGSQAPRGRTSENVRDLGTIFPTIPRDSRRTGGTPHRGRNYNKNQEIYRNHAERGWTGEVQLEAMDTEGIDVAVLFPTRGLGILTFPDQNPRFAAAMARAYNDWLHDFCTADPNRLLGAGMISVYDINDALSETRRVAEEYGFRSVFLRSNITRRPRRVRASAPRTSSRTLACAASMPNRSSKCWVSAASLAAAYSHGIPK